jgi:hypothetical protein
MPPSPSPSHVIAAAGSRPEPHLLFELCIKPNIKTFYFILFYAVLTVVSVLMLSRLENQLNQRLGKGALVSVSVLQTPNSV